MHSFEVDGRVFLAELFWEDVESSSAWRREARESFTAKNMTVNAGVLRPAPTPQVGLLEMDFSDKRATEGVSAAVVVAEHVRQQDTTRSPSYLVALPIRQGTRDTVWYLTGGDNGVILPGFDRLIEDEADAQAFVTEALSTGEWDRVIAPADWQIGAHEEVTHFDDFLPRDKKGQARIPPSWTPRKLTITPSDVARRAALPGLLVALGLMAYLATPWVMDFFTDDPAPSPTDIAAPIPERVPAWESGLVRPAELVESCQSVLNGWPVYVSAWSLSAATCEAPAPSADMSGEVDGEVVGIFERDRLAPTGGIEEQIDSARIDWEGGGQEAFATARRPMGLEIHERPMGLSAFWERIETLRRVYDGVEVELRPYAEQTTPDGQRIPPPDGRRFAVSVITGVGPAQALEAMTCSATQVTYSLDQQTWSIEGLCYASD